MGDSRDPQNTKINEVIGENEKCVPYFTEKTKRTFGPTQYFSSVTVPLPRPQARKRSSHQKGLWTPGYRLWAGWPGQGGRRQAPQQGLRATRASGSGATQRVLSSPLDLDFTSHHRAGEGHTHWPTDRGTMQRGCQSRGCPDRAMSTATGPHAPPRAERLSLHDLQPMRGSRACLWLGGGPPL